MLRQIVISIGALRISKDFIIKYRLWDKWQSMRWIYTTFAVLAIALGFKMLGLIADGISNLGHIVTGDFDQVHLGLTGGAFLSDWNFTNSGFYNYVFLFLVMSFVFHFGGRALEILYGIPYRPTFRFFVKSQIRTVIAVFICFILEQVLTGLSSAALSIMGGAWLKWLAKFLIQSFLFGAIIIDGLHEMRGWSINKGIKHSFDHYPGVAVLFGAVGLLFSKIPFVGIVLVGSVLTVGILLAIKRVDTIQA
ncbi:MAG: hypothetical protein KA109_01460 [Saprospiraceae bacterium]|jgi:hypothetical protein|nr:hypothetical protein [Saprospiraceae bacterium]MBK6478699.1 hypothetical protein [Saprospiraceae bacterium]MBK6814193.1 hypothetical protein [Saprospiraceae bacterium]MBK7373635.1 hypothetical protein [Saprospiraceae bacterium]MBK7437306.1 hypothetical protein [Saprospiraceae bacterium]